MLPCRAAGTSALATPAHVPSGLSAVSTNRPFGCMRWVLTRQPVYLKNKRDSVEAVAAFAQQGVLASGPVTPGSSNRYCVSSRLTSCSAEKNVAYTAGSDGPLATYLNHALGHIGRQVADKDLGGLIPSRTTGLAGVGIERGRPRGLHTLGRAGLRFLDAASRGARGAVGSAAIRDTLGSALVANDLLKGLAELVVAHGCGGYPDDGLVTERVEAADDAGALIEMGFVWSKRGCVRAGGCRRWKDKGRCA
jgi:hypothetical protein